MVMIDTDKITKIFISDNDGIDIFLETKKDKSKCGSCVGKDQGLDDDGNSIINCFGCELDTEDNWVSLAIDLDSDETWGDRSGEQFKIKK